MKYIKRFSECGINDVATVGGKNASLGEMYSALSSEGVNVPNGFAISAGAYKYFLKHNDLYTPLCQLIEALDPDDIISLADTGRKIRDLIMNGEIPDDLSAEISIAYRELEEEYGSRTDVAVRSSATTEDLPDASFAGQQETYLNISGIDNLLTSCRRVFASLYTDRAISYRIHQNFDLTEAAISVGVQKMVRADLGASGVIFTLDTESGFSDVVFITSAYGLGENIVQGMVNPDEFYVYKNTLRNGHRPIIRRQLGEKALKMIYSQDPVAGLSTKNINVEQNERNSFSLTDDEVLKLSKYSIAIENHYSNIASKKTPMDIEWAKDGIDGELYIVQARYETVQSRADPAILEKFSLDSKGDVLCTGKSVGQKIATGKARVIHNIASMSSLIPGEVLVTDITDPDWEPVMKLASAIVTNRGGRTCHAAIVARELGIPAVVGCGNATNILSTGREITVSCAEGDIGYIYDGIQKYTREKIQLDELAKPVTKIMLNIGNPELAFKTSFIPNDGVGLARLEFIINNNIKIHPKALIHYDEQDEKTRHEIDQLIAGYPDPVSYYRSRLAEGIATIAAAFYPKKVIVRLSDFKSNEYASLVGGSLYEPKEENPMLGFRGAYRYPSIDFSECFKLECQAIKHVRESMGLDNISLMIPFVRTVDEARNVLQLMEKNGLQRGDNGLNIYLMCELPANALLADEFLEYFDGFSIGSNDLTQLTLGVDRDSGLLSGFDERNQAVLMLMDMAITKCKAAGKYIGICGQAPSDFPEITRWLVEKGISSISLNPDSVPRMMSVVSEVEHPD